MDLVCRSCLGAVAFEPVAGAFEGDDVGVVDDAVDHRGGDGEVAEDIAPRTLIPAILIVYLLGFVLSIGFNKLR